MILHVIVSFWYFFYVKVAYLNKARLEHEASKRRGKKRAAEDSEDNSDDGDDDEDEEEDEMEEEFDMSSVTIPDLGLLPHAVSQEYHSAVSISLRRHRTIKSDVL